METTLYGPSTTLYAVERAAPEAGYFVSVAADDGVVARLVTQVVEGSS